jgi:tetratricopeptide (TPR) repeat protein
MRTRPVLVPFLLLFGCPKAEPQPELVSKEVFQLDPTVRDEAASSTRAPALEVVAPNRRRLDLQSVRATNGGLEIVLAEPSPPGTRLSLRYARSIFSRVLDPGTKELTVANAEPVKARAPAQGQLQPIDSLIVLLDSSASSVLDWRERVELARSLVEALGRGSGPSTYVHVAVFDQVYERIYEGTIGELPPEAWQHLLEWRAFGGSSYSLALAHLAATGKKVLSLHRFSRALVIGDGVADVGATNLEELSALAKYADASLGVKRFDAIAFGRVRDEALLRAVVEAGAGARGNVIDADVPLAEIARRLSLPASPAERALEPPSIATRSANAVARVPDPRFAEIDEALRTERREDALAKALAWRDDEPLSPLPLLLLTDIYAALNDPRRAARAAGSLIDLHPSRAEMYALAASRLETLKDQTALIVAVDAYAKAVALAPDRPVVHRLYAYALLKVQHEADALAAVERAMKQLPVGPAQRILRDDAALIAAAWIKKQPERRTEIAARLVPYGTIVTNEPSLSFALSWNEDVDVDLAVIGAKKNKLPLSPEGSSSFGPEVAIAAGAANLRAYPYAMSARVHGLGPLGFTSGALSIVEHDGHGGLWFAGRSFLLIAENGTADLGQVTKPMSQ